jgi:molecular chaperone GrpE
LSQTKGNGPDADLPVVTTDATPDEPVSPAEGEALAKETHLAEATAEPANVEALRQERDELKDMLLRRRADFENYRKRVERDRQLAATDAEAALFRELLGTVDNLERALAADGPHDALRHGVELTRREFIALLESHGVVAIDPLGERFDPRRHQALLHEPVLGLEEGTVAEVYRKGYSFGERLLRPALVKVAKAPPSADDPGAGGDLQ